MKKMTLEEALKLVPMHYVLNRGSYKREDSDIPVRAEDPDGVVVSIMLRPIPEEVRIATAKTVMFMANKDNPGVVSSPDLYFARFLLQQSGFTGA